MPVVEIKIEIVPEAVEKVETLLADQKQTRWMTLEDRLAARAWIAGYFDSETDAADSWRELAKLVEREMILGEPEERALADEDWRESYKAHFKAWRCGTLHWVPEWERATHKLPRGHAAVFLDPGLAFGTGNHETTRLCVQRLVEFVRAQPPRRRRAFRVIDAGCGSGILAISAAKLGIEKIFAFDNDAGAVAIARENARRNGVASLVRCAAGGVGETLARRRADLVLANIQADVLVRHAHELLRAVAPGGALVLSGILVRELRDVRAAFASHAPGWRVSCRTLGEWADLLLVRVR